ncbi:hypothetical protein FRC17_008541 [Serendipita sp. 399]|nr:hypothetical protein FRC17_008541 [Serendipita sp. 399]
MQDEFTNVGYREGITKGKEDALQEGFDNGFAGVGVPIGRRLGVMRGIVAGLLAALKVKGSPLLQILSSQQACDTLRGRLEILSRQLNSVRLKDVAPRDLQAEQHAREHRDIEKEGTDDALAEAFLELSTSTEPAKSQAVEMAYHELRDVFESLKLHFPMEI